MMRIENNYPLINDHTFHIPVYTKYYAEYENVADLVTLFNSEVLQKNSILHIGSGSNLLFCENYEGVILHSAIRYMKQVSETDNDVFIKVGSGVVWDEFVAYAVTEGWGGAENLSLIPGEVGATAVQNIGAYGVEAKDIIEYVETFDTDTLTTKVFSNQECRFGYRSSAFKKVYNNRFIITAVTYKLSKQPKFELDYGNLKEELAKSQDEISLSSVREAVIAIRREKLPDPELTGNAGSFFMNPVIEKQKYEQLKLTYPKIPHYIVDEMHVKVPAAWLIDHAGWKGYQLGGAAVHDKQCLVLINKNHATAAEIVQLANRIRISINEKFNIDLHPEVIYVKNN